MHKPKFLDAFEKFMEKQVNLPVLTQAELTKLTLNQPLQDFSATNRRSAIWATDARKIAEGKSCEVYLEKIGQTEREDISHIEAVQWGLKLQDVIGREVSHRLKLEIKEADYELQHKKHSWMKSHFDFITEDGKTLIEVKNYNQSKRNQFDDTLMPLADRAQCIHEAAVHGVNRIILAVLFGGQELVTFDQLIPEQEMEELIKTEAELWGLIQTRTPPTPDTPESARKLWPTSNGQAIMANQSLEDACTRLKALKAHLKRYEEEESKLQAEIQATMREAGTLLTFDGRVLATWNQAKASVRFDPTALQREMPEVYHRFQREQPGSRRFLLK